jgi:hypothetical protein
MDDCWALCCVLAVMLLVVLLRMCYEEGLREAAQKALTAEKMYSRWLRDRLHAPPDDTALQHIVVPRGPAEDPL